MKKYVFLIFCIVVIIICIYNSAAINIPRLLKSEYGFKNLDINIEHINSYRISKDWYDIIGSKCKIYVFTAKTKELKDFTGVFSYEKFEKKREVRAIKLPTIIEIYNNFVDNFPDYDIGVDATHFAYVYNDNNANKESKVTEKCVHIYIDKYIDEIDSSKIKNSVDRYKSTYNQDDDIFNCKILIYFKEPDTEKLKNPSLDFNYYGPYYSVREGYNKFTYISLYEGESIVHDNVAYDHENFLKYYKIVNGKEFVSPYYYRH